MAEAMRIFDIWAPAESVWSQWAKPVVFAAIDDQAPSVSVRPEMPSNRPAWVPAFAQGYCLVLDLPGEMVVNTALVAANYGFRPIPLFNGCMHPQGLVPVRPIAIQLLSYADDLQALRLVPSAPPVFMLDRNREGFDALASGGKFDNRWMTFPQDFPSGNFLRAQGIGKVIVVRHQLCAHDDLMHVLLRWHEAGIEILEADLAGTSEPRLMQLSKPSLYKSVFYQALVTLGLRRNSAGGFGSIIPEVSHTGGFG